MMSWFCLMVGWEKKLKKCVRSKSHGSKKSQKHKISHLSGLEACQLSQNPFCKGCEVIIDRIKKFVRIIF